MKLSNIIDRIKLPFRKEKELFSSLYEILGFYPRNIEYYKMALMHKSIRKRNDKGKPLNNERLEFLGDAILDAAVGYIVYRHYEGKREGFLTNTRSKLVSRETLGKLATEMRLSNLLISAGHSTSHNSYVEGNAFEALVGAIYLDRGYEACLHFFEKQVLGKHIDIDKVAFKEVNFKSKLLEWSQKNRVRLEYKLTKQKKDEHGSPVFTYMVVIEGVSGESGSGYSKKEAQQKASKDTLQRLKREPQFVDAVFAAKTARTQMEEEPAMAVPDPEKEQQSFIIEQPTVAEQVVEQVVEQPTTEPSETPTIDFADKEFDLSDISHKEKSREEIIAEAEAAAFSGE
ncbi:ribonuclease III [Prevotella sp. MA2016]|uniref:ribonuclease III n=1 Tax=Prevotella sp. MA2016 TaxID=1408310 RepID=UPI00048C1F7D|nr:ribonuclease III [Prevotella sp. MA2016]